MSAIYGVIDLNGNSINAELPAKLDSGYKKCKIDRYGRLSDSNVFMACGIQYFYPRAERERLPIYDADKDIFLTADCIIDNRKKLIEELALEASVPDGDIIFEAYKKWGKECASHLEGLYSFVIYDRAQNEIYAAADQFSQRCLFYHVRDGVFYFSTLFFPLVENLGLSFEENERWLVDTVSIRSPLIVTEPKETSFKEVYKLVAGEYITVRNSVVKETRYFDPKKTEKTDWTITLEQSEKMVRETVAKALEDILQEQENVSAQLSAGLDSSTVACNAAIILNKRGGKVYSYTSVPMKDAGLKDSKYVIVDETEGVKEICRAYDNIIPTFVGAEDRNFLLETENIIDAWELPCKSQNNAIWLDEIYKIAAGNGQRVLLSGATGNTTFSAGSYTDIIYYYAVRFRFISAYRVLSVFDSLGIPKKRIVKGMVKDIINYYKWYFDPDMRDCYKNTVTQKQVGEKYHLTKRFNKTINHFFPFYNMKRMRRAYYLINSYSQMGEYETKGSLLYGIITRDPTRTVSMVKMCYKMPIYCYANKDLDRRLIRVGMKGIVPDSIISNVLQRGRQSADNTYKVGLAWDRVREDWEKMVLQPCVLEYIDREKVEKLLQEYDQGIDEAKPLDVLLLSDLYSFAMYLSRLRKIEKIE